MKNLDIIKSMLLSILIMVSLLSMFYSFTVYSKWRDEQVTIEAEHYISELKRNSVWKCEIDDKTCQTLLDMELKSYNAP